MSLNLVHTDKTFGMIKFQVQRAVKVVFFIKIIIIKVIILTLNFELHHVHREIYSWARETFCPDSCPDYDCRIPWSKQRGRIGRRPGKGRRTRTERENPVACVPKKKKKE